jgi:OFA family oxalate/formate antiporter-like MFS transporter
MSVASTAGADSKISVTTRWSQLIFGIICMVMIANLQYGWNLFVDPIDAKYHWGRPTIQAAFTLFVLTETWLVPVEGWFVDRYGPSIVVVAGGVLVAIAWVIDSMAASLWVLYAAAIISGIGAGAVYGTCVGNALKWFADRRGLAAGLTAAGFGAGAAATVVPIRAVIDGAGYEAAFLWFGIVQGFAILIMAQFLKAPQPGQAPRPTTNQRVQQGSREYAPQDLLCTPLFWVLYVMFVAVAAPGLALAASFASVAKDYGVANSEIIFFGIAGTVLTLALQVDNVLNGLARPFFGWVSDQIGREVTMCFVFCAGAASLLGLGFLGTSPVLFVIFAACVFFTWGEIYSLFPATCTDAFGSKFAATNAGMLYTAKGTGSMLVPIASIIAAGTGNWHAVFVTFAILDVVAAVMAMTVLRPMLKAHIALDESRAKNSISPVARMPPASDGFGRISPKAAVPKSPRDVRDVM